MGTLGFKATGDWNLQGGSKKELYISLVTKIDDWKKNIIFYKSRIEKEEFDFLLRSVLEAENLDDWEFSVSTRGGYMNSIYASQIIWIKDKLGKLIFEGKIENNLNTSYTEEKKNN